MSELSITGVGGNAHLVLQAKGVRVELLISRERLLAVGDAAVHVATDVVGTAVVKLPNARWAKDGKEVL